jgi:hypothetical protein
MLVRKDKLRLGWEEGVNTASQPASQMLCRETLAQSSFTADSPASKLQAPAHYSRNIADLTCKWSPKSRCCCNKQPGFVKPDCIQQLSSADQENWFHVLKVPLEEDLNLLAKPSVNPPSV